MEPKYSTAGQLAALTIICGQREITISAKDSLVLQRVHLKLKREISHNGFNDIFKPLKRLGRGSFATVYLVQHKVTGEKFAAKVFSREIQKIGFMGHESLQTEINMLRTLEHQNIIRF